MVAKSDRWAAGLTATYAAPLQASEATSGRLRVAALILLVVAGTLLVGFGIAQPLILRAFHLDRPGDLTDADVISVLVTVVALLTASVGALTFVVVTDRLQSRLDKHEAEIRKKFEFGGVTEKRNTTFGMWAYLKPLSTKAIIPGSVDEAIRDRSILIGTAMAERAYSEARAAAKAGAATPLDETATTLDLALFVACRGYFVDG